MLQIYSSKFYSIYQSDDEGLFAIDFDSKTIKISFCQLLALRHKVNSIAIEDHFDEALNKHGFEILTLCNKEHLFVLNTLEILDLKDLVNNAIQLLGIIAETNFVEAS